MKINKKIKPFVFILLSLLVTISSCKKKNEDAPTLETGSVTDIDGNSYKTVKIGNQWWMAEDLRTKRYNDSSYIASVAPPPFDTSWQHYTTGALTNNINNLGIIIGRFYNFYAVTDHRGIAPKGWHIPSDIEWKTMEQTLGMSKQDADNTGWRGTHEGEKLKVIQGTNGGWTDFSSVWSTNESGFSALAGGCRMFDGSWGDPGQSATGFWWTSSLQNEQGFQACYRYLDYKNATVFRYYGPKTYGFSVRCIKD